MSTNNQNPIEQVKLLEQHFEQNCINCKKDPNPVGYYLLNGISKEKKLSDRLESDEFATSLIKINRILFSNYGYVIGSAYRFYKYCAENSIYPVYYEIDHGMITNHTDKAVSIDSLVEKYKNDIIEIDQYIYDEILNKIKFFHDCGFHMIPGEFTIMTRNEVSYKINPSTCILSRSEIYESDSC